MTGVLCGGEVSVCEGGLKYVSSMEKRHCLIAWLEIACVREGLLCWCRGRRDCPILLNHHPDLCPHCGWCHCTWIHTPSTNTYERTHGQTLRDTHTIYQWHCCGNNRDDPNHQREKKGKLSPIPLARLHFIASLHCALLMTWHWGLITYNRVQPRCRLKVQITL